MPELRQVFQRSLSLTAPRISQSICSALPAAYSSRPQAAPASASRKNTGSAHTRHPGVRAKTHAAPDAAHRPASAASTSVLRVPSFVLVRAACSAAASVSAEDKVSFMIGWRLVYMCRARCPSCKSSRSGLSEGRSGPPVINNLPSRRASAARRDEAGTASFCGRECSVDSGGADGLFERETSVREEKRRSALC